MIKNLDKMMLKKEILWNYLKSSTKLPIHDKTFFHQVYFQIRYDKIRPLQTFIVILSVSAV